MKKLGRFAAGVLGVLVSVPAFGAVPFKGSAGVTVVDAQQVGQDVRLSGVGTGEATQLGRFTRTETLLLHPDGSFEGSLVFTAANGDELRAGFSGGFTSQTTAAGTYTFTGGSGRFVGAQGTASFSAATADGAHFAISFDGELAN